MTKLTKFRHLLAILFSNEILTSILSSSHLIGSSMKENSCANCGWMVPIFEFLFSMLKMLLPHLAANVPHSMKNSSSYMCANFGIMN